MRAAPCQRLLRVRFSDSVGWGPNDCKLNLGIFVCSTIIRRSVSSLCRSQYGYPPTCVQTNVFYAMGLRHTHTHTHTTHSHTHNAHTHTYIFHTARSTTRSHVGQIITVVTIFHCPTTLNVMKLYTMLMNNRSRGKVYAFSETLMYYQTPGYFFNASGGLCEHILSQKATVSVRNMLVFGTFHKVCAWNWLIQLNLVIIT